MNAFLFAVLLTSVPQDQAPVHTRPAHPGGKVSSAQVADTTPVTVQEVRESFVRMSTLFVKVNGHFLGAPKLDSAARPATRAEILGEMERIYREAEPTFIFTPAPVKFESAKLSIDSSHKTALEHLITRGCVGRVSPLAVGPQNTLTARQFGDALGFFMARLAEMSHLPSPKWTPMLQKG